LDPFLYLFDDYIWYLRTVNNGEVPKTYKKSIATMADIHNGSMAHNHNYIYIYKGRDCMVK